MSRERAPGSGSGDRRSGARTAADDPDGLELAQSLIALHRAERAPRAVVVQVASRLAGGAPRSRWSRWWLQLDALLAPLAGWAVAGVVALLILLLVTWQHQRLDAARRRAAQAEQRSNELSSREVTVSGVAVPGSLQLRMYGDEIGMGHCEGSFLLEPQGSPGPGTVRVHWTRCDLPDLLAADLRRVFSPVRGAPPFPVTVRGSWTRPLEFEALGVQLPP